MLPVIFLNSHPIQYFAPMYRYLANKEVQVKVLYCTDTSIKGAMDHEFGKAIVWDIPLLDGYDYCFLPNKRKGYSSTRGFFSLINLSIVKVLRKEPKSVVVVHSWNYFTHVLAIVAAKLCGHVVAVKGDSSYSQELLKPRFKNVIKNTWLRLLFCFVDRYMYVGTENKLFYQNLGANEASLVYTPYAVNNQQFQQLANSITKIEAREKLGVPADVFVILFTAKYIDKKHPLDLLSAFKKINNPKICLLMVGEGQLRKPMEEFVEQNSLKNKVKLTGFINQSEIGWYYKAADVFVMSSGAGENWGLSVNEAMNFSLPVVVSNLSGCSPDLVDEGKNGFVFKTGDINWLAQCIMKVIDASEAEKTAMGRKSLEIVDQFSYQQFYAALERL